MDNATIDPYDFGRLKQLIASSAPATQEVQQLSTRVLQALELGFDACNKGGWGSAAFFINQVRREYEQKMNVKLDESAPVEYNESVAATFEPAPSSEPTVRVRANEPRPVDFGDEDYASPGADSNDGGGGGKFGAIVEPRQVEGGI